MSTERDRSHRPPVTSAESGESYESSEGREVQRAYSSTEEAAEEGGEEDESAYQELRREQGLMERRGFFGTVGATIAALFIPWKDMPDFQKATEERVQHYPQGGFRFGQVHIPARPYERKVIFKYEDHPPQEGPTISAGKAIDIPYAEGEGFEGVKVVATEHSDTIEPEVLEG